MKKPDFSQLARDLVNLLPQGAKDLPQDLEQNIRDLVQAQIHKMDLVTREEFDAQVKVLHRARQRIAQLEEKIRST